MNYFGKVVKQKLIENDINQNTLANIMNVSRGTLSSALNRDNISLQQMQKIADALNCELTIELKQKEVK